MANKEQVPDAEPRRSNFLEPKEIKRLIGILSAAGGLELELEDQGRKLRIRMPEPGGRTEYVQVPGPFPSFVGNAPMSAPAAAAGNETAPDALPEGAVYLNSPTVGTFYRAPAPDAEAFVNVGDRVTPDTTVCIVEAMKVMNEIKAEQTAEILKILVEDGKPIEYGQPLFLLKSL